ncbi:MAG: iron-containing alcohol dehydrogenase [Clostridiales bacterium]|nr:iron-containing alcohol dehydrogenase [Clostridiales bacterium]
MQSFRQYTPTEIVFGRDAEKETGRLAVKWQASRVMVVYGGKSAVKSGLLDVIEKELESEGIVYTTLPGVVPNPRLSLAREGVKKAIDFQADLILAVGGGSVIDTAKAVAIGAANPGTDLWDFWIRKVPEPEKVLPVGVVLTIAAAGSEMSDSVVLTNDETGKKKGYGGDFVRPKFAVMNPELAFTLPKYQVACGVVDILMHTLERYFTPVEGNILTDEIAEGLMRTITKEGKKAYDNPTDYDAMSEVMWCGSLSHNGLTGLGRKNDFSCHKLGHELSGRFDVAHGASLSAVWGSWAGYVYKTDADRFARYGKQVWGIDTEDADRAAKDTIARTEEFFRSLDMPTCIGELRVGGSLIGVQPEEVLREMADSATDGGTVKLGCFQPMDAEDMFRIYKMADHD